MGQVIVDITPMGAVRMTQNDMWKPNAKRYLSYKGVLRHHFNAENLLLDDIHCVLFVLPIPKSHSKKKQQALLGSKHLSRPDTDNLVKGIFDVYKEDGSVWTFLPIKVYGEEGKIVINPTNLKEWLNESARLELTERLLKYLQQ